MNGAPGRRVRSDRSPPRMAPKAKRRPLDVDRISGQTHHSALPELRHDAATRPLPSPADVRTRELLGVPIAMTDYEQAMDVMDGMVARRERGYVCAVAVHALTVGHSDPEMKEALLGSTLVVPDGMPLVWAANLLGENLPH